MRGDDELGRLAGSFNEMMAALERSEAAQRRLVADASHELRTPLATLRTNIETLGRSENLDPEERKRLVADVTDELEGMTELVGDVVELARAPGQDAIARQDVALDELTRDAIERAQRRDREMRVRAAPRALAGPRRRAAARPCDLEHARQRQASGARGRVRSTSPSPAARSPSATTARASPRTTSTRSSTASGVPTTPAAHRARGWAWRSCSGSPTSTTAAPAPRTRPDGGAVVSLKLPEIEPNGT